MIEIWLSGRHCARLREKVASENNQELSLKEFMFKGEETKNNC